MSELYTGEWVDVVYKLAPDDLIVSKPDGPVNDDIANLQMMQLRSRTDWLKDRSTLVGEIKTFVYNQIEEGYLVCNGGAVSRTTYNELFSKIGVLYGNGDGVTTFNLPNYVGRFIQGDTKAGTYMEPALPNITGTFGGGEGLKSGGGTHQSGCFYVVTSNVSNGSYVNESFDGDIYGIDASRSSSIYKTGVTTVQPPALTAVVCIKY